MSEAEPQKSNENSPIPFEKVLDRELDDIAKRRTGGPSPDPLESDPYRKARAMKLSGLAFSGGGIRSAVFNLGFLQGLANRGVVHGFDYLSTVSGGGYVGGWLSALLKREAKTAPVGEEEVRRLEAEFLATPPAGSASAMDSGFVRPESAPVRFLRRYADYLDPRMGLSGDTLALVSLVVRNVAVMQMLLVSMLVAAFAGLLLAGRADELFRRWELPTALGLVLLFTALLIALVWSQRPTRAYGEAGLRRPNAVIFFGVLMPALAAGVFLAIGLEFAAREQSPVDFGWWVMWPAAVYVAAWLFTLKSVRAWAGAVGGAIALAGLLYFGAGPLGNLAVEAPFGHLVAFAPPIGLALQSLVIVVHLALAGSAISEHNREWWARAGGQGMFLALVWTLAFSFLLYAPPLIAYGTERAIAGGGLWAALSWIGSRLANGKDTGGSGASQWKEIAAKLAPWIFVAGLLALAAWAFAAALPGVEFAGCCTQAAVVEAYLNDLSQVGSGTLWLWFGASALVFVFLLGFVDLNIFSAHSFYRNRLARTFMGASHRDRKPNAFTGFDPKDDIDLDELAGQRPVHLVNATLNLTGGEELAWQTRRGASFVFTPHYCGYSTCTGTGRAIGGYRPTERYAGRLSLATAVAVSGAAASPNMGFHTSTSVAALLTVFNMRLARWCPNPEIKQWRKDSPAFSAAPLFAELLGDANGHNSWLDISDGGHFDNLGLYELVRRRAALILVTDAGADGDYRFDDLAMLVRKLSVDFGVELQIEESALDQIRPPAPAPGADPDSPPRFSRKHWAFGRIRYPDDPDHPGYLIYVKSSLTADAPIDIRQYRDAHPAFPHESTADQWFDEDQFETYRHLGEEIAESLMDELADGKTPQEIAGMGAEELVRHFFDHAKDFLGDEASCPGAMETGEQSGR